MAIDFSGFAFPKSRVKALDKADKAAALAKQDKAESAKAKKRAKGLCEVIEQWTERAGVSSVTLYCSRRCHRKDTETHHLIGGIGRRNKGKSILAQWKLRVCTEHHQQITAKVLKPTTAEADASTIRYWRAK
jgi:hypothetical protein